MQQGDDHVNFCSLHGMVVGAHGITDNKSCCNEEDNEENEQ